MMAYFNVQYQHIPLKTEHRLRQDNHFLGWESTFGSLDYEINCYKPPLFVMDFAHHPPLPHTQIPTYLLKNSIFSQNIVFSFEREAPFRTEQYWVSFQGPHWYMLPHHNTVKNCSYKYNHYKYNYLDTNSILYLWWGTITLSLVPFTYFRCSCHFPGFQRIAHWVRDFIRNTKWW
jgi:hypothetical protein